MRGSLVVTSLGLVGFLLITDFDGSPDAEARTIYNPDGSFNPLLTTIDTHADTLLGLLHPDHASLTSILQTLPSTDPEYAEAQRLERQCERLRSSAFSIKAQIATIPRSSMGPEVMSDTLNQLDIEQKGFTEDVRALKARLRARGLS